MKIKHKNKKVVDTWTSQAVPHLSTDRALQRLASEFERDPACSLRYGRWRTVSTSRCRISSAN